MNKRVLIVDLGVLLFGIRMTPGWCGVFFGRYGFVLWGEGKDQ